MEGYRQNQNSDPYRYNDNERDPYDAYGSYDWNDSGDTYGSYNQYQQRDTRQSYRGGPSGQNRNSFRSSIISPVNTVIIILNILVFAAMSLPTGGRISRSVLFYLGANYCELTVEEHQIYRTVTAAFMHGSISHLVNNMLVLAYIGDNLERALGKVKYILFYLLACVGSGLISAYWHVFAGDYAVAVGASGAIFAIAAALFYIVIRNRNRLEDLTTRRLGLFIVLTAYSGFVNAGVDNAGHIGGIICGLILAVLLYRKETGEGFYRRR